MSRLYRWPKKGLRIVYKIRHHRGHGIHSPFVFNLINNVIEEKLPYYFYDDLTNCLTACNHENLKVTKENRLAFRMINRFSSRRVLEIGSGYGINTLCLVGSSKEITCIAVERDKQKSEEASKIFEAFGRQIIQRSALDIKNEEGLFDCIFINLDNYNSLTPEDMEALLDKCHEKSFIMVKGIRRNRKQNKLWRCLTDCKKRTVELDLFHIGIIFFDKQLYRWSYQISF